MADILVNRVCLSGALLASLLENIVNGSSDSDGILFGSIQKQIKTTLQDHGEDEIECEEVSGNITSYSSHGRLFSFYNSCGEIQNEKVKQLVDQKQEPIIGWYLLRRNSPLRPSMREYAASFHLKRYLKSLRDSEGATALPMFFILFTGQQDGVSAVHSYDYKAYQCCTREKGDVFVALKMQVVNIGPNFRGLYDSFAPVAPTSLVRVSPSYMLTTRNGGSMKGGDEKSLSSDGLQARLETVTAEQVSNVEELYVSMLENLEAVANEVCESSKAVEREILSNERTRSLLNI